MVVVWWLFLAEQSMEAIVVSMVWLEWFDSSVVPCKGCGFEISLNYEGLLR